MRGTPGSAYPQPEPNATEPPSSAPGRPKLKELQASAPSPTRTRAEEHIATTPATYRAPPRPRPPPRAEGNSARCRAADLAALRALAHADSRQRQPLPLALSLLSLCCIVAHIASFGTIAHCPNPRTAPRLTSLITAPRSPSRTPSHFQSLQGLEFCTAWVVRSVDRQGTAPRIAYHLPRA